jgi:hypothetical protein
LRLGALRCRVSDPGVAILYRCRNLCELFPEESDAEPIALLLIVDAFERPNNHGELFFGLRGLECCV